MLTRVNLPDERKYISFIFPPRDCLKEEEILSITHCISIDIKRKRKLVENGSEMEEEEKEEKKKKE